MAARFSLASLSCFAETLKMNLIPIYRWNGKYYGFIREGFLFDASGNYVGWLDAGNEIYRSDGTFLGELFDDNYVLGRVAGLRRIRKIPRIPPIRSIPPIPRIDRIGRLPVVGWCDALDEFI